MAVVILIASLLPSTETVIALALHVLANDGVECIVVVNQRGAVSLGLSLQHARIEVAAHCFKSFVINRFDEDGIALAIGISRGWGRKRCIVTRKQAVDAFLLRLVGNRVVRALF